jgi:hypothetical protein
MFSSRLLTLGLLASVLITSSGCSFLHEFKPHRLWRLNRSSNAMQTDAYYSVSDPIPNRHPS